MQITINGKTVEAKAGQTIMEAAEQSGHYIPSLCYHKDLTPTGNCGVCVVKIEGVGPLKRACVTPVADGMSIVTDSPEIRKLRKELLSLILLEHDVKCPTCDQNGKCELQELINYLDIPESDYEPIFERAKVDNLGPSIVKDTNKCIHCGRCITVCNDIQKVHALCVSGRGFASKVTAAFDTSLADSPCVNCGQCTVYCPVGALKEKSEIEQVQDALFDPSKIVVVQEAPSVRAALGEEFGMDPTKVTVGKMYAALRRLGFDRVFDTNFAADLTIMEEGSELIQRIKEGGTLPLITSCSPGWVKFVETYFPDLLDNVSTCKSPQQMFGAMVKTYFAEQEKIDPKDIVSVSIMPCTAKKFEAKRPEMNASGYQDVDCVLTVREFVKMIKAANLDFKNLPEEEADQLMGQYTGAGTIFGATGGVMEAAIRTAYAILSGKELGKMEVEAVRGMQGIKEASLDIPLKDSSTTLTVNVAVVHGLGNAKKLLEDVQSGKKSYHFIEIMACPGGCVGGGGQPYGSSIADRARRGESLYKEDKDCQFRASHTNPMITKIYKEFLGEPLSHKSHQYLHTHYKKRNKLSGKQE